MNDPTMLGEVTVQPAAGSVDPTRAREIARLRALLESMGGGDVAPPTQEEIQAAAGDPVATAQLIGRSKAAQDRIDATRDKSYLTDAGRMKVANPWGAISDMFVRGKAGKERDAADKEARELGEKQRAAAASISAREIQHERAEGLRAQLSELEDADRAQKEKDDAETQRLAERTEDRRDRSLRDELDENYRRDQLAQAKQFHDDEMALGRERIGAAKKDAGAADATAAKAKQDSFNAWQVAKNDYMTAHKNAGWGMETLGDGARVRKAAESNMAPILKNLFRTAGEGTFTDKDQELLLGMVPNKWDSDEVAQQKLDMVDRLVRAKMGIPDTDPSNATSDDALIGRYK